MGSRKKRKKDTEAKHIELLWAILLKEKERNRLVLVREILSDQNFLSKTEIFLG